MHATSSFVQPIRSRQASEIGEQAWVSAVLRRAAGADDGRLAVVSTLADADLWRIWRGTERGPTARDKRTHETTGLELARRGLLDPTGQPSHEAADAAIDGECPDVA